MTARRLLRMTRSPALRRGPLSWRSEELSRSCTSPAMHDSPFLVSCPEPAGPMRPTILRGSRSRASRVQNRRGRLHHDLSCPFRRRPVLPTPGRQATEARAFAAVDSRATITDAVVLSYRSRPFHAFRCAAGSCCHRAEVVYFPTQLKTKSAPSTAARA
jgi:hypothetical protein